MIHLTPQQLSSYMDGELDEVSNELVRRHMGVCEECTLKFAALEEQEEQLAHALVHDPGEEFFESFAADVERQLPPGKESGSKPRTSSAAARAAALRQAASLEAKASPDPIPSPEERPSPRAASPRERSSSIVRAEAEVEAAPERPAIEGTHRAPEGADARPDTSRPVAAEQTADEEDHATIEKAAPVARPLERRPPTEKTPRADEPSPPGLPSRPPLPSPRAPSRPAPRRAPVRRATPSIPWYAAMILIAIAAAAGLVASRTATVSNWLDSLVPHRASQESPAPAPAVPPPAVAPTEEAPATGKAEVTPSDDETSPGTSAPSPDQGSPEQDLAEPQPQAADRFLPHTSSPARASESQGQKDPFADLAPAALAQIRVAQKSKADADDNPSASRYDATAAEWERALPLMRGAAQQNQARLELASAKYRAWEIAPTRSRAMAAAVSIRAYVALAPQGPAREQARSWLGRIIQ